MHAEDTHMGHQEEMRRGLQDHGYFLSRHPAICQ